MVRETLRAYPLFKAAAIAAVAAGITLASQSASATPSGWYFGVEGFGARVEDSDNRSSTPGTPGTTTPSECSIFGLPPPDTIPGLPGNIICLLPVPGTTTPGSSGTSSQTRFSFDDGAGGGLSFGYAFEGGFRPEMTISYTANDINAFTIESGFLTDADGDGDVDDPVPPGTPFPGFTGGEVEAIRASINGWFDIGRGAVSPYFGAGLGVQETSYTISSATSSTDESDTTLSYLLGAGIGFEFVQDWMLSIDYRYTVADKPKLAASGGSEIETEYKGQTLGLGLKYVFAPAFGTDSDGDGVPDRKDKCPNTPKGVQVYSDGCPLDLDGDGVPDYLDKCPGTPPGVAVNAQGCEIDSDGDGVPDSRDECPGTPKGVRVDPKGCPLDSDRDGVPDYLDKCPGTPAGVKVNELGCAASDADGDGVPDELDKCKDTPPGIPVGPDGCPLDSDGDGIPDYLDECPNSPPGAKVLPNGCALKGDCRKPRPGEQVDENGCAVEQRFILRGVKFEFDSDRLLPESKEILNDVAATLQSYPDVRVEVEGHTDDIGTDAYNLGLSERRANSVKTYLVGRGIRAGNLIPVGYGESRPIMTNDTEPGREENRRVEFKVVED